MKLILKDASTPLTNRTYIPGLDGMRAIAFAVVFVGHSGLKKIPGGFGVTIFFFLSGYLITTLLRIESDRTGTISISQFYLRRTVRIFPPMYVTLAVWALLAAAGVFVGTVYWQSILVAFFYLTNYINFIAPHGISGGLGILWSLAVEEHFYLLFPWLFLLFLRRRWSRTKFSTVLAGLCAGALVWRYISILWLHSVTNYYRSDTRFDSILFGCLLAVCANPFLDKIPDWMTKYASAFAILGLVSLMASMLVRGPIYLDTLRYSIQGIALAPVFFYVLSFPESRPVRYLEHPVMRTIGRRSYAMYLIHLCIILAFNQRLGFSLPLAGLASAPLTFAYAWAMWRLVENPLAQFKKGFQRSPEKASVTLGEMNVPEAVSQSRT